MNDPDRRDDTARRIWSNPDLVLLIFAGSAAEFALNRAVDWLFFTGNIPSDPIGRFFSTVAFAQQIVFADDQTARRVCGQINSIHGSLERKRGRTIPEWAYRDVLYMLVYYSERAHELVYRPLSGREREELYESFYRLGEGLHIRGLPRSYSDWQVDRRRHLDRDLVYSRYTLLLYRQYRRHLGPWRYFILVQLQALLAPEEVRRLLGLKPRALLARLVRAYTLVDTLRMAFLLRRMLVPPSYWPEIAKLDRRAPALSRP